MRESLGAAEEAEPQLVFSLVGVGAGGMRRAIGGASHSLKQQLLRGQDAVDEPVRIEQRGVSLGTLWHCCLGFLRPYLCMKS